MELLDKKVHNNFKFCVLGKRACERERLEKVKSL